jgi:hypothetical protein
MMGLRMNQSLGIGIGNKKLHAFQPGRNHVVDSIATGAATRATGADARPATLPPPANTPPAPAPALRHRKTGVPPLSASEGPIPRPTHRPLSSGIGPKRA